MKVKALSLLVLAALTSNTEAASSPCDYRCASYCAYYYPSTECMDACGCAETVDSDQQRLVSQTRKLATQIAAEPATNSTDVSAGSATTVPTNATQTTATGSDSTESETSQTDQTTTTQEPVDQTGAQGGTLADGSTNTGGNGSNSTATIDPSGEAGSTESGGDSTSGSNNSTATSDDQTSDPADPVTDPVTEPDSGDVTTDPVVDPDPIVDPAVEESKATCVATCGLKCKSESSDKKDACVDLCFNQCTASIALYVQESERPLLKSKSNFLLALNQQQAAANSVDTYLEDAAESKLRMDDYMMMKMKQAVDDSPQCTSSCVAHCGRLAELPRTEASQLVGCFQETCGCRNKWNDYESGARRAEGEPTTDLMRQYFDLIHQQERVEYLMLQQDLIHEIVALESAESTFLSESDVNLIKQRLNSEDGLKYYEGYISQAKNQERSLFDLSLVNILMHLGSALLITVAIVLVARFLWHRVTSHLLKSDNQISFDCEQAILKKQRLETGESAIAGTQRK